MTRIGNDFPARISQALRSARATARVELGEGTPPATPPAPPRGKTATAELRAVLAARLAQIANTDALTDDELLTMAIQETLVMEFGHGISLHPKFASVVQRVQATLSGVADMRRLLGIKPQA